VDANPGTVMRILYEQGYAGTPPDVAADHLGLDPGAWFEAAARALLYGAPAPVDRVPEQVLRAHHVSMGYPQPPGGSQARPEPAWQQRLRLGQALWREQQALPPGTSRGRAWGNLLPTQDPSDPASWQNFLNDVTRQRVAAELRDRVPGRLIQPDRLLHNLLSSQPLAFNLFTPLDNDLELATAWARRLWPDRVAQVLGFEFEWSPGRGDPQLTGTHSAFDVAMTYWHVGGGRGLIGFETKYHEDLRQGTDNTVGPRIVELARTHPRFQQPDDPALTRLPLSQIYLDHALALALAPTNPHRPAALDFVDASFVLLFPGSNPSCRAAALAYRERCGADAGYQALSLELAVGHLRALARDRWITDFHDRYLDERRIEQALGAAASA
jgi:hypothetical protein